MLFMKTTIIWLWNVLDDVANAMDENENNKVTTMVEAMPITFSSRITKNTSFSIKLIKLEYDSAVELHNNMLKSGREKDMYTTSPQLVWVQVYRIDFRWMDMNKSSAYETK